MTVNKKSIIIYANARNTIEFKLPVSITGMNATHMKLLVTQGESVTEYTNVIYDPYTRLAIVYFNDTSGSVGVATYRFVVRQSIDTADTVVATGGVEWL